MVQPPSLRDEEQVLERPVKLRLHYGGRFIRVSVHTVTLNALIQVDDSDAN